ncbi:MAG: aminoglycoside phosphotransferase family protein [Chloroflexi bacterium]|nr:aminoglycoside phosphotransferase family protein [Chloroflexota bacterium]
MSEPAIEIHVLLPRPDDGSCVLIDTTRGGQLPIIRPELREDDTLVMAISRHLGPELGLEDATILETYLAPAGGEVRAALAAFEAPSVGWQPPDRYTWGPPPDPVVAPLRDRAGTWLAELRGARPVPDLRARWSRAGWQAKALGWIDETLAATGRRRAGPIEVRRIWTITALMRVPTDGGDAWFKGVFPLFDREPIVTRILGEAMPHALPRVLGLDEAQGWLLLDDVPGPQVGMSGDPEVIRAAVSVLVDVQRASIDRREELTGLGVAHRPLSALAAQLESAIASTAELGGPEIDPPRAAQVVDWVAERASWLDGLGFPEVVVHGDFNRANVLVTPEGPVIIDWSDAAIGHPLLDVAVWMVHPGGRFGPEDPSWDAWLGALASIGDVGPLRDHRDDVFALGAAYQVVSYTEILGGIEPAMRYQLSDGLGDFWELLEGQVPRD